MIVDQVEDAIITAITNAALAYKLKAIESYGGQLDDELFDVVRALPAVWVTFAGVSKPIRKSADKWLYRATFATIVAARNVRSEKATRRGSVGEPGVYTMFDDVKKLVIGQDYALPIARLEPGAIRTLYNTQLRGQAMAAFAQEWHTAWIERVPPAGEDGTMWLKAGLNYYLKPGDDTVDASDEITLA
jgi:phage gp37-like protein